MTARETALLDALDELEQKRETYLEDSLRREEELRKEHAAAADDAERGLRGLLTSQGDDLVAAVQVTLEDLGFSAQNRDEVNPLSDRLEDLWVTSPVDDPDWIAIAEVKGYAGGAQVSALLSITGRFVPRFFESRGRYPSRKWYIVNQFIGQDPGTRPPALSTNPNELAEFESQQGLVIDTSVLFSLARDVETGRVSAEAARRMLIESVGRFELEPGD